MTATPLHLLLIEDNPGDACLVKELLREAGTPITVTAVDTLAAAQQLLAERRFDLVLTDLWLPDSQNFETFTRLFNAAPHTPIIVLTGFANEKLGVQAVQAGADSSRITCLPRAIMWTWSGPSAIRHQRA
jgi:CheY-like chemotaxis protein